MSVVIQLCGLSGSGKTTVSQAVKKLLFAQGHRVELIDGDEYRANLCPDLTFSKKDRMENIRRLGFVANKFASHGIISIIAAINPYEEGRSEVRTAYRNVSLVYVDCPLTTLLQRDTKGLYKRALLEDGHPDKIYNLTGVNDPFEAPANPDLVLNTEAETIEESASKLSLFILSKFAPVPSFQKIDSLLG